MVFVKLWKKLAVITGSIVLISGISLLGFIGVVYLDEKLEKVKKKYY